MSSESDRELYDEVALWIDELEKRMLQRSLKEGKETEWRRRFSTHMRLAKAEIAYQASLKEMLPLEG